MSPERAGRVFLLAACICAGAVLVIGWAASRPLTLPAARTTVLRFDPASALRYTKELAERYPNRVTGSSSSRRAAAFLASRFRALGYHVELQPFEMWLHGKRVAGQNVIAFRGAREPYVAVVAHYDAATTTVQAAEDDASGVGTVLELARTRRSGNARAIFAATDAEEWGMIGARHLGAYLRSQGRGSVISIDYVNAGNARAVAYTASGQFSGYTPLWLRQIAGAAALREAGSVEYSYGMTEWIDRAVAQSFQDQGPLLQQGIPAINLMSVPGDIASARERYHTPQDVFSGFAPRTFAIVGRTAERIEDALADPRRAAEYDGFLLSPNRYLPLPAVYAMQFIALLPLLAAGIGAALQRPAGAMRFAALMLPPLAALLAARVFALTNFLPRYQLDPATPKDPFLYHVPPGAGFALIAITAGGYAVLLRNGVPVFSKNVLVMWTAIVAAAAFFINPYGMWLYLGVLACGAPLFAAGSRAGALAFNAGVLCVSAVPFAAILSYFGREIFLEARILWYLVLQVAYGVWSPPVAAVAVASLVLWVQYARTAVSPSSSVQRAALKRTGSVF